MLIQNFILVKFTLISFNMPGWLKTHFDLETLGKSQNPNWAKCQNSNFTKIILCHDLNILIWCHVTWT